jgi:hypothetical protein
MNSQIQEEWISFVPKLTFLSPGLMKIYQKREVLIRTSSEFASEELNDYKDWSPEVNKNHPLNFRSSLDRKFV